MAKYSDSFCLTLAVLETCVPGHFFFLNNCENAVLSGFSMSRPLLGQESTTCYQAETSHTSFGRAYILST